MSQLEEKIRMAQKRSFFVLGIVAAAVYWITQSSPDDIYKNQIAQLKQQVNITEKKVQDTQEQFNNKPKFREDMERVSQTFRLALDYLPKELDIQDLLKSIYLEARTAGVELANFKPKETVPKDFYDEVPMDITVKGGYSQIVTFLALVSKLPRIVTVQDVEIGKPTMSDGPPIMEMTGVLVGYRYKEGK